MDANLVNPFLKAILKVLVTMAQMKAIPGKMFLKKEEASIGDVTGIIGMASDKARGSIAISFKEPTICEVASRMLGEKVEAVDDVTADLVGEITNMTTGGAKRTLAENGYKFDLAIPTIVVGENHAISHKTEGPVICVPSAFITIAENF